MAIVRKPRSPLENRLRRRIDRAPSPTLAAAVPWVSVMLLSLAPFAPFVASAAIMPPLAFMATRRPNSVISTTVTRLRRTGPRSFMNACRHLAV